MTPTKLCAIANVIFLVSAACGQEPSKLAFQVHRECELVQNPGGYYRVLCDAGSLPLGSTGSIRIVVHNSFDRDVELGNVFSGCSCIRTTLSETVLKKGHDVTVDLILSTPAKSKALEQIAPITIAPSKEAMANGVQILVKYHIQGLVAFKDQRAAISAAPEDAMLTFRLPILVSNPTKVNEVIVKKAKALETLKTKIVSEGDACFLECAIPTSHIGNLGMTGELTIANPKNGIEDSILCTLILAPPVTIAPNPVSLTWSDEDNALLGSAFVQIAATKPTDDTPRPRLAGSDQITATAKIAGAKVVCTSNTLGKGIARLKFRVTPDSDLKQFLSADNPDGIFLALTVGGATFQTKCPLRVGLANLK